MDEILSCSRGDGMAVVTLNRPHARNALSAELRRQLQLLLAELDADDDVGAIVLTGADPAFCAGVDLRELEAGGPDTEGIGPLTAPFVSTTTPLIGAVNGAAYTGGLELALSCHILVASERASFADTHTRLGLMPGWGLTVLLSDAIGDRRAREMSLTSDPIDAQTAYDWGLVGRVVRHEELLILARDLASRMCLHDKDSVRHISSLYQAQAAARTRGRGNWRLLLLWVRARSTKCMVDRTMRKPEPEGQAGGALASSPSGRRNRHEAIFTAAIAVFSERGYAAASLQDVADSVGLLKGSLYHYISSKESLLYEIFQDWYVQAVSLMRGIDALELPPSARLREFVRQLTLFYARDRERAGLYFSEWRHLAGDHHKTVMAQRREFELYVLGLIREVEKQGLGRDELEAKLATRYLLTAVNGVVLWYRPDGAWSADEIAEQIADMTCAFVLRPESSIVPPDRRPAAGEQPARRLRPKGSAAASTSPS